MPSSNWETMSANWGFWTPPLRPHESDVDNFMKAMAPRVLLLGYTEELADMATVIIDRNPAQVEKAGKRGVLGDWYRMADPAALSTFDIIIGDGCLNIPEYDENDAAALLETCRYMTRTGGKAIFRVYLRPNERESIEKIVSEKDTHTFHGFKWRIAAALANPCVRLIDLYEVLAPLWYHPTLEMYKEHPDTVYYFPRMCDLPRRGLFETRYSKGYELSERCPVVTWIF